MTTQPQPTDDDDLGGTGLAYVDYDYTPASREYEKCKDCGEDLVLRHYCGDVVGAVAEIRALHHPPRIGKGNCRHCHFSWPCPTIAALDKAGCP